MKTPAGRLIYYEDGEVFEETCRKALIAAGARSDCHMNEYGDVRFGHDFFVAGWKIDAKGSTVHPNPRRRGCSGYGSGSIDHDGLKYDVECGVLGDKTAYIVNDLTVITADRVWALRHRGTRWVREWSGGYAFEGEHNLEDWIKEILECERTRTN